MYHIRQALLAMRANIVATMSTLTTMTITLLVLGAILLITLNVNRTLEQLESQVEIAAFLNDSADDKDILIKVAKNPLVRETRLIEKKQILEEMTRDYPYAKEAAELGGNPFPNTIRMRVAHVEDSREVAKAVQALPGVQDIEYGASYVDPAIRILTAIRTAGYILVGLLLLGTLFNILNAVQVAMYSRRNEIEIMRLLGATSTFIRMPHLVEGLLVGFFAAALSMGALYFSYINLAQKVSRFISVFSIVTDPKDILQIIISVGLLGIVICVAGSMFATRRYLRELE